MEENKEKKENKIKFSEKASLFFRRKWLVDGTKTFLIVAILIASFIALNLWVGTLDLPEIDVTENKVFTLTDASKDAVKSIENDIKIYAYGFAEDSTLMSFLKQYNEANPKITSEILTEETNINLIKEYGLQSGYQVLVLVSGDSKKIIDSSNFSTYDYTTFQTIDVTEQVVTNSILSLTEAEKPVIYFLLGHSELSLQKDITSLGLYLDNEAYTVQELNLLAKGAVPEDCDVLAIPSPKTDISEQEATLIKDYIAKGGDIFLTFETLAETVKVPNLQSVLAEYGATFENGYIMEINEEYCLENYPQIFVPQASPAHDITADIYTDSYMWISYASRITWQNESDLAAKNVTKETLLSTSDVAAFITDLSKQVDEALKTAKMGTHEIASIATKTVKVKDAEGKEKDESSKLVVCSTGTFMSDYYIQQLSESQPLLSFGSNKDFALNSFAFLSDRENSLTIRKDMATSTYTPTATQNRLVILVIFVVPVVILITGLVIWKYRKMRI